MSHVLCLTTSHSRADRSNQSSPLLLAFVPPILPWHLLLQLVPSIPSFKDSACHSLSIPHHMSLQWAHCKRSHYWATSPLASGTENTPNRGHPVGWASTHTIGHAKAHSLPQQAELFRFTRCSSYIRSITPGGRCHPMHHHCSPGPLNLYPLAALACLLR